MLADKLDFTFSASASVFTLLINTDIALCFDVLAVLSLALPLTLEE